MKLSFRKASILGATGPTGRFLAQELHDRNLAVRVVSRSDSSLARAFGDSPVEKVPAGLLDAEAIPRAVEGCDLLFDCIGLPMDRIQDHPRTAGSIALSMRSTGARCAPR